MEKCETCGYIGYHNSLCPNNIINVEAFIYRHEQTDEEYYEEQLGDKTRNDIEAFFYNEECGDR